MDWNARAYCLWLPVGSQAPTTQDFETQGELHSHAAEIVWNIAAEKFWGKRADEGWIMAVDGKKIFSPNDIANEWPSIQRTSKWGWEPH